MKSCLFLLVVMALLSLVACGRAGAHPPTPAPSTANEWSWESGANVIGQPGTYGTQGTPSAGNIPGSRYSAVSSTDAAGNFWLFGGSGAGAGSGGTVTYGDLNDLWKYSSGQW